MFVPLLMDRQKGIYGRCPRQVAADGGFASEINLTTGKSYGIKDIAFAKRMGISIPETAKSAWVYKKSSGTSGLASKTTSPCSNELLACFSIPGPDRTGLCDVCAARLSHTTCSHWEDLDLCKFNACFRLDVRIAM